MQHKKVSNFLSAFLMLDILLSSKILLFAQAPSITLTSGNNTQLVCNAVAISSIQYTLTNAGGATLSVLPPLGSNLTGAFDASSNHYTIIGTPTTPGIYTYTLTTTNSGGYADESVTGTIQVSAPPNNTVSGFNGGYICEGASTAQITFSAKDATFIPPYTIEYTDSLTTWTQVVPSPSSFVFDIPVTPTQTTQYWLVSITNGAGCKTMASSGNSTAVINVMKIMPVNTCAGGSPVTFLHDYGMLGGAWSVSGGGGIDAKKGIFTPATAGRFAATYTNRVGGKWCSENFVVFPAAAGAPVITSQHNEDIVAQPPTAYPDFDIQYSFDDGATWGVFAPPPADNCEGYKIRTRYVLNSKWGKNQAKLAIPCSVSPATTWIVDKTKPVFSLPRSSVVFCVADIADASYNELNEDINQPRPEHYVFLKGNTALDLNPALFSDNCCSWFAIHWQIDFADNAQPPIQGAGQPSAYTSNIYFAADGVNFTDKMHKITYRIEDCNGNKSEHKILEITVKPRPDVQKVN